MRDPTGLYAEYCRPKLADLLGCLKLDREYVRASGDYLYCLEGGRETAVLDFVGGFGTTVLGHNHPELKAEAVRLIQGDTPFAAQTARRHQAALLAEKLNDLIPGKARYRVNFSNSGAESVEAAIKHAYKVRFDTVRRRYEEISRQLNDFYYELEGREADITLPDTAAGKSLCEFRDDIDEYNLSQLEDLQNHPVLCAWQGSFHGKTISPLKVTSNKTYREGFEGLSAIQPVFLDPRHPERFEETVTERRVEFLIPRIRGTRVELEQVRATKVVAMILEVIQGEGGIRIIPDETLAMLAEIHTRVQVPYIIDEIQTGCGRTGAFYGYELTPLKRIDPEYILLSKALGGALFKTAATLIRSDIYDPDFGILHTSTFAEDELSSAMGLKTLSLLTRNRNALLKEITRKGKLIVRKLEELRGKYPHLIREVRGRGLMIALEFAALNDSCPFLRYAARQGLLSLLVASYLLNRHNIRVFAPLSTMIKGDPGKPRPSIVRIQPSAFISTQQIEQLAGALEETLKIIDSNNEYCLVAHLIEGALSDAQRQAPEKLEVLRARPLRRTEFDARTGFIMHPTSIDYLVEYYFPSFRKYDFSVENLEAWWNRVSRFLDPELVNVSYVRSGNFTVENNMIAVPYLPGYLTAAVNAEREKKDRASCLKLTEIRDKIQEAVTMAKEIGDERVPTAMVGLGAYTSIVTDRGLTLNDYEVPVTTGNAFTSALMFLGIKKAAELRGIELCTAKAAVVGGAGNIGTVIASLLCRTAAQVRIIGRPEGGVQRLRAARSQCLRELLEAIRAELASGVGFQDTRIAGLGREIYRQVLLPLLAPDGAASAGSASRALADSLGADGKVTEAAALELEQAINARFAATDNPFISLHTDLKAIRECEIVAIATNSPDKNLVGPRNTRKGAVVCCASVPSNLSEAFKAHMDDYFVFDGGFARLPEDSEIDFVGMPGRTVTYGCLCETLLLAFDGRNRSFAKGPLTAEQVFQTIELAERYGFSLGEFKLGDRIRRV